MESMFASEPVPDGYKLVVEEDTGEWLMIVMGNDTANQNDLSQQQQIEQHGDEVASNNSYQLGKHPET